MKLRSCSRLRTKHVHRPPSLSLDGKRRIGINERIYHNCPTNSCADVVVVNGATAVIKLKPRTLTIVGQYRAKKLVPAQQTQREG